MRDIVGFEGLYKVTSCGQIWSCRKNRFLKAVGGKGNYQMIGLWDLNHKVHLDYIHRIVAKAYLPNPDHLPEVNHKDEVRDNNCVNNLEWCNRHYNMNYGNRDWKALKKGKPVYCVELDKRFPSILSAAKATGVAESNLGSLLRSKTLDDHTLGGYHWRYAD